MSVEILEGRDGKAVFTCNTSGWAFGPVMGSGDEAEKFLEILPEDPRRYSDADLEQAYLEFVTQYVCECGDVADGKPGQDEEEEGEPSYGYPRTDGERFVCDYCQKKRAELSQVRA
jgi:hypothetical protein